MGDETIFANGVNEFTDLSSAQDRSILIGQGNIGGGIQVWINNQLRQVVPGSCRAIHARRGGDEVVFCYYDEIENASYAWKTTIAELASLKPLGSSEPTGPTGPTDPIDTPEDTMPEPESLLDLITTLYSTRPHATNDDFAAILNEAAWTSNGDDPQKGPWGLSVKPSGNNATLSDGTKVAYDILHHLPTDTLWDCFGPSEAPKPLWGQAHPHNNPDRPWKAPIKPQDAPGDDPGGPTDPPPSDDLKAFQKAVKAILGDIEQLKAQGTERDEKIASLMAEMDRLSKRTFTVTIEKKGFGPLAHSHGAIVTPVDGSDS
jgi:hypothetical protein